MGRKQQNNRFLFKEKRHLIKFYSFVLFCFVLCFSNTHDAPENAKLTVGFELPGDMLAFGVTPGNGWVLTREAFVAGTNNLEVSARWAGCCACCCGDEGLFLTKVNVKKGDLGIFLAGGYGMIEVCLKTV